MSKALTHLTAEGGVYEPDPADIGDGGKWHDSRPVRVVDGSRVLVLW